MFRRLPEVASSVTIEVDGRPLQAAVGDSVAAALLAGGLLAFRRHPVGGEARAPWCLVGNCHECLLEIDGQPNRQSCLVEVREGMRVRRPLTRPGDGA